MSATTQTAPRKRAKRGTAAKGTPGARRAAAATAALAAPPIPHTIPAAGKSAPIGSSHPLMVALFQTLPEGPPPLALTAALAWFQAAAVNFKLAYGLAGSIGITAIPASAED
jgi:hypothetical protein